MDDNGRSWRSGAEVQQRCLEQWFFRITDYCEDLLKGLEDLNWPKKVKTMQENWIGKSKGAYFDFPLEVCVIMPVTWYHMMSHDVTFTSYQHDLGSVRVFTTKPETIYGVSYLALSPDHEVLGRLEVRGVEGIAPITTGDG